VTLNINELFWMIGRRGGFLDIRDSDAGIQLLERVVQTDHSNGCKCITLPTDTANGSAQRFHQKHKFSFSTMIPLRLSLGR